MKIDFSAITEQCVAHVRGGEKELYKRAFSDGRIEIMLDRLACGASIGLHTHEDSCEVIYVLSGVASLCCDGAEETVLPAQAHYCPKGGTHTMQNNGAEELVFLAIVPKQ